MLERRQGILAQHGIRDGGRTLAPRTHLVRNLGRDPRKLAAVHRHKRLQLPKAE